MYVLRWKGQYSKLIKQRTMLKSIAVIRKIIDKIAVYFNKLYYIYIYIYIYLQWGEQNKGHFKNTLFYFLFNTVLACGKIQIVARYSTRVFVVNQPDLFVTYTANAALPSYLKVSSEENMRLYKIF